jgi:thiol-disulfide isomerase/thioredoxin
MRLIATPAFLLILAACVPGCSDRGAGHPLLGQKAPTFSAPMLDDSSFELAQHLNNNVIILDFWATWCGPCVRALPIIADVAASYKGQGVEFFAVNLGDEPAAVRAFLEEHKLSVPVVLDRDNRIGELYKADAIPQTVIIGKDGVVQVVHVGFSANLQSELSHELDALVAGKKLASGRKPAADRATVFAVTPSTNRK